MRQNLKQDENKFQVIKKIEKESTERDAKGLAKKHLQRLKNTYRHYEMSWRPTNLVKRIIRANVILNLVLYIFLKYELLYSGVFS